MDDDFAQRVEEFMDSLKGLLEQTSEMDEETLKDYIEYASFARSNLGDEYDDNPSYWEAQIRSDWEMIRGATVGEQEDRELRQMGGDLRVLHPSPSVVTPSPTISERDELNGRVFVDWNTFLMESNQGIFTESTFYLDKGRRWMKNVEKTLEVHGYPHCRKVRVGNLLVVEVSDVPFSRKVDNYSDAKEELGEPLG